MINDAGNRDGGFSAWRVVLQPTDGYRSFALYGCLPAWTDAAFTNEGIF